ncbi:MAG: transposase [Theionarchaea archaeon]|nr:transposase [Theionarchaea archaeon]
MTRNWKEYNKKLVRRGEFYLTMDFIEHWNEELQTMNVNKRGSPFAFPQSFIAYTVLMKTVFNVPYRQLEGILEKLSQYIEGLTSADYTTLWRRIHEVRFLYFNQYVLFYCSYPLLQEIPIVQVGEPLPTLMHTSSHPVVLRSSCSSSGSSTSAGQLRTPY